MDSLSELHVVYGNGPVGTSVADTLREQGKRVRVVTRSGARKHIRADVEVVRGDATDPADARRVCEGATHVYNCTNPTDYHRWPEQFPPLQRGVLEGAAANHAKLIVMENLSMYGPHDGAPMTEDMPMRGSGPRSATRRMLTEDMPMRGSGPRSATRRMLTEELFAAHQSGRVRVASGRASDLFGPQVGESMAGERLFGPALAGKTVQMMANLDVPHSFSYIGDVGKALVTVGEHDTALGHAWHAPNAAAVTPRAFVEKVFAEIGASVRLSSLPRPLTRALLPVLGLFMPPLRGLAENLYIMYEPYIVDHSAYVRHFGNHATPLNVAIRETVRWRQSHAPANRPAPEVSGKSPA
ncbi:MAG: NAD-dependent epimerase/dehydratase family protein [Chloroflexi bacterium]|nr:NAD-dependent epimerase/dehydratase family protein [Chloroflexota bacterium]